MMGASQQRVTRALPKKFWQTMHELMTVHDGCISAKCDAGTAEKGAHTPAMGSVMVPGAAPRGKLQMAASPLMRRAAPS